MLEIGRQNLVQGSLQARHQPRLRVLWDLKNMALSAVGYRAQQFPGHVYKHVM